MQYLEYVFGVVIYCGHAYNIVLFVCHEFCIKLDSAFTLYLSGVAFVYVHSLIIYFIEFYQIPVCLHKNRLGVYVENKDNAVEEYCGLSN